VTLRRASGIAIGGILIVLSGLHLFWLLPSQGPGLAVIPTLDGHRVLEPSRLATLAVAVALASAAALVLLRAGALSSPIPARWVRWGCGLVGLVFLLRAIGELRFVGFFKSVQGTPFALWDTWLYSPLCLLIGTGALWLAFSRSPE